MASATATQRSGLPADQQPPHSAGGVAPRPFTLSSNLAISGPGRAGSVASESGTSSMPKYRASIGVPGAGGTGQAGGHGHGGGSASANWRAVSPGRASTGGVGLGAAVGGGMRPASELLGVGQAGQALNSFQSSDTEAIDRWFEDLQQYEATLEEMAAASLDANFKEELSAIEQWFRVLSEAERTAALYSLLQNATPLQTRFFITVLQQMARQDPVQAALLSPANPSQLTFESQIESKLASLGLSKSPASPAMRQFARQSLSASNGGPMPTSPAPDSLLSPDSSTAASTLANQRAKLKASARTSAPADLLLSAGNTLGEGLRGPLWSKEEVLRERSPSPRPHSTGSDSAGQQQQPSSSASLSSSTMPATAQFLRSPALDASFDQLSPAIGGSWASMVNTPLVPMFGKGETMETGNFGTPSLGASWNGASPNPNGGIVLDDVKKYRRSARMSGLSGGALAGMYEEPSGANAGGTGAASLGSSTAADRANSAATAQKRIQDQLQAVQHLKNMQQSAVNLGLGALSNPASPNVAAGTSSIGPSSGVGGSRLTSTGALSSPGLQQTAMAAQQNWRNANAAHLPPPSPNNNAHYGNSGAHLHAQHDAYGASPALNGLGVGNGGLSPNLGLGVGNGAPPSPNTAASVQAQAQAQLASLIALQQQMMQQQAQLQSLANLQGLNGLGMGLGNQGLGVGAIGGFGSQLSPRLGGGVGGGPGASPSGFGGFGFGGAPNGMMHSPRRSPRPHGSDRSPNFGSSFGSHASRPGYNGVNSASSGGNPQQTPGSGANPDEPLDMNLLGDTPAWLRSLRLHKYTPNFEGVGWKEMVLLGDKDLEDKGVSALGARRKLLKVFETVRGKTGMALPGDGAEASSPIDSVKDDVPVSPVDSNHASGDANNGQEEREESA